jgi:hypothetical protein
VLNGIDCVFLTFSSGLVVLGHDVGESGIFPRFLCPRDRAFEGLERRHGFFTRGLFALVAGLAFRLAPLY